jgi:hypothetical protein
MAVSLQNLRELCEDQLDIVMKVERFRKAILEDIENLMPFNDPIYQRQVYSGNYLYSANTKNVSLPSLLHNNNYAYGAMPQQMFYTQNMTHYGVNQQHRQSGIKNQILAHKSAGSNSRGGGVVGYQKNNGYQLKVGGVVVGSWATNRSQPPRNIANRAGMVMTIAFLRFTRNSHSLSFH